MVRGDLFRVKLPPTRGREQRGPRYAVIVQADELLGLSTAIVAPTSRSALPGTFRPQIAIDGEPTRVLVEQLRVLDVGRLEQFAGHLDPAEQRAVDDALELVLALR